MGSRVGVGALVGVAFLLIAFPQVWAGLWPVLFVATLLAANQHVSVRFLRLIRWQALPLVGQTTGIAASLVLAAGTSAALVASAVTAPSAGSPTPQPARQALVTETVRPPRTPVAPTAFLPTTAPAQASTLPV